MVDTSCTRIRYRFLAPFSTTRITSGDENPDATTALPRAMVPGIALELDLDLRTALKSVHEVRPRRDDHDHREERHRPS